MNIQIKNSSNDPIYLQIKNQIRDAIINGELEADEQLPSIRFLAKELRISVITTKRAYDELEADGFIHSVQGKGSFVAPQNSDLVREKLLRKTEEGIREMLHYAGLAGLSHDELMEMIQALEDEYAKCGGTEGLKKEIGEF
ncbi:MAG: GntR family transcriptional regulator [Peptoniphilaceae bacterium]|nr:GntR family transcriptional regulator [Peptoniphilaceae bacterium]MCI6660242.1 GntR family transcriptional regulator [Peptoniphilaceae bacterium]MDD7433699.1 GntR family transcriptional regulator [Peptoniphilaceae bacterium]MDY3075535.1 GntR family transcriptional regulator [Peptoniphilaceae bacterium]MDY3987518.1 GntR family transcriptional regulator [Peptoniphilaceae bacterium]